MHTFYRSFHLRRLQHYPGRYDKTKWDAEQSEIPSQQTPVGTMYDPRYQIDEQQQHEQRQALDWQNSGNAATDGTAPASSQPAGAPCEAPANGSYVGYGFESRPPLAQDFVGPLVSLSLASVDTFVVPPGYTCIIKQVTYSGTPVGGSTVDMFGNPINSHSLLVSINGNPIPGYSLIDVSAGAITGFEIECFILCRSGDTIQAQIFRGFPGVATKSAVPGGVNFYGTLLSDDGRDISLQVGSKDAEPVALCASSISAIRPNPMVLPGPDGKPVVVPSPINASSPACPKPPFVSVNDYLACIVAGGHP